MMSKSLAKNYSEQLRDIVKEYRHSGESWPATSRDIATWAYNNGEIIPQPGSVVKQIARDIANAMREDYHTDPQGRTVRTMHAARKCVDGRQKMLWDDIRTAEPAHIECAYNCVGNKSWAIAHSSRKIRTVLMTTTCMEPRYN